MKQIETRFYIKMGKTFILVKKVGSKQGFTWRDS